MRHYDLFVFGSISIGTIQTPEGEHVIPGGSILFAAWTAHQLGCSLGIFTKTSLNEKFYLENFPVAEEDLFWHESAETTKNRAPMKANNALLSPVCLHCPSACHTITRMAMR